jgi:hypothetical protein
MTATRLACGACGVVLRDDARFCDVCGAPVAAVTKPAEYKQVTVLFADVLQNRESGGSSVPYVRPNITVGVGGEIRM